MCASGGVCVCFFVVVCLYVCLGDVGVPLFVGFVCTDDWESGVYHSHVPKFDMESKCFVVHVPCVVVAGSDWKPHFQIPHLTRLQHHRQVAAFLSISNLLPPRLKQ